MPLSLQEKTLLSELRRKSSFEAFERFGGKASLLDSVEGRMLLRAFRLLHRNGGPEILDPEAVHRAVTALGGNRGEVVLGEPLAPESSREVVWQILAQRRVASHHARFQEEAREGRLEPETMRRVVSDWKTLSQGSALHQGPILLGAVASKPDSPESRLPVGLHKGMDLALGGGIRRKEVGIIVGPTDHGKTANLLRVAVGLSKRGFKVFFMSFEVPLEVLKERAQAVLGKKKLPRSFFAQEYPSDDLAVEDVVSLARQIENLDCLLVDHLDLLRFDALDLVNAHGSAVRKLRNYAIENQAVVWTAAQADEPEGGQLYLERHQLYGSRQRLHASALAIGILYQPARRIQTYMIWKTKHARNGLRFMGEVDFVKARFRDL